MLALNRSRKLALVASTVLVALVIFVSLLPLSPSGIHIQEGEIASRTIRAPRDISFVSPALTAKRQDEAAAAVPDSLTYDPSIAAAQQSLLNTLLGRVHNVLQDPTLTTPEARQA